MVEHFLVLKVHVRWLDKFLAVPPGILILSYL